MRTRHTGRHVLRAAGGLLLWTSALTAAFYLTASVNGRLGWHPPGPVVLILNTVIGMIFVVAVMVVAERMFGKRRRDLFTPITDALARIATGDFSIRLEENHSKLGAVGGLVHSVNQMAVKLDEMEKMRQEFISNVSHEIQSPLTSIRGFACALQQDDLSVEDRRHYLDIIEAESMRLSKLSANLLKLASLESDQVKFEPKTYRLDAQIRGLILACEPQWSGKRLGMDVTLDEALIAGDEDLLSQVWTNLLHNCIKFTPEGGSVCVSLHRRGDRCEVCVADTGIGIRVEDQARIFERFYKADLSRQSSAGGSGLGLSIAKKVVEMHGGSIGVKSEPGGGAAFTVELPAANGARLN